MIHPSYTELIEKINSGVEPGEEPVVQSRYSIVIAASKRARQIIAGEEALNKQSDVVTKPLSQAVAELDEGIIHIMSEEEFSAEKARLEAEAAAAENAVESDDEIAVSEEDYDEESDYESDEESAEDFDEEAGEEEN